MLQGNGHPIRLLVLAGPDIQGAARWAEVPQDAVPRIVGDPYAAAVELVRGAWDVLLVDPGYLSSHVLVLIEGAVKRRGIKVWLFETAGNPALFHQALHIGAVPLSKGKPSAAPVKNGNGNGNGHHEPQRRSAAPPSLPAAPAALEAIAVISTAVELSDEEAIRAALGYGGEARKKRQPVPGLDTIVESGLNTEPVLTDAELRALLGEM